MDVEPGKRFFEDSTQYMCCCNHLHVRKGTLIIAVLAAIGLVFNFISYFFNGFSGTNLASSIVALVIGGSAIACVFYALHTERAAFLIPYIVLQIFGIFIFVALIVFCIFALAGAEFPHTIIKQTLHGDSENIESESK